MAIFLDQEVTLEVLNETGKESMSGYLEIEFTEIGSDYLIARMPINQKTVQPLGMLHGGASVVLAETIGSVASTVYMSGKEPGKYGVGLSINANHVRPATSGYVYAKCTPVHLGRTTHVWDIRISNELKKPVCISRLTVAVVN